MPLSKLQSGILRLLAAHRDPESYVAGSSFLTRQGARFSEDPAALATNEIMAAAGRREPRGVVDLVDIHQRILPLGAVAWAAVGKSLGFTPEGLINEVRRLARYRAEDFNRVASAPPADAAAAMQRVREALDQADTFVRHMPTDKVGLLFLQDGQAVQPDPDHLEAYGTHAGARRGHWPSSAEISHAMLQRYGETGGAAS